jgi:hypothetical protein
MSKVPHVPTDEETARRSVAPYLDMTPEERLLVFASLLADMDVLLDGREPVEAPEDPPFWMRWKDPCLGRPS